MGPRSSAPTPQDELFQNRLENLIDQRHELVRLAELIDWEMFDRQWGALFSEKRGAPAMATRLITGLHYLKHTYNLSDEAVVRRSGTSYPQACHYFSAHQIGHNELMHGPAGPIGGPICG